MGEIEIVPEGLTPQEFATFALSRAQAESDGYVVFKKCVGGRTIVLWIRPGGVSGSYTASLEMRQGTSRYAEPGGSLKDITAAAGCELYAWLDSREACDTMQKALVSPTGQALALCALFRLLHARNMFGSGTEEAQQTPVKEIN